MTAIRVNARREMVHLNIQSEAGAVSIALPFETEMETAGGVAVVARLPCVAQHLMDISSDRELLAVARSGLYIPSRSCRGSLVQRSAAGGRRTQSGGSAACLRSTAVQASSLGRRVCGGCARGCTAAPGRSYAPLRAPVQATALQEPWVFRGQLMATLVGGAGEAATGKAVRR